MIKHVVPIVYLTTFLFLFGESLQPAPRTEIYERIICRKFYATSSGHDSSNHEDCKVPPVQEQLALLVGIERLSFIIPSIFAIPFGALADYFGHNLILSVAIFGVFFQESWPFLVCWFPDVFPIKLIWLHFVFSLVGGGATVIFSLLHVIVVSVVDADTRTSAFLRLRAASVGASILGYATAGVLMKRTPWLPWVIGNLSILFAGAVSVLMPKTSLAEDRGVADQEAGEEDEGGDGNVKWSNLSDGALTMLRRARQMLVGNGRVAVVLVSSFLSQIAGDSVSVMLILYVSKRFGWSFADANMLFSLEMSFEFFSLIVLLPLITSILTAYGLPAFSRSKYTAQASMAALALGVICIGLAPVAGLVVLGLVFVAAGAGQDSLMRSLATDLVSTSEVSILHSSITVMRNIGVSVSGPIHAGLYAAGLKIGGRGLGLPFLFGGGIFIAVGFLLSILKENSGYEAVPEEENGGGDEEPRTI